MPRFVAVAAALLIITPALFGQANDVVMRAMKDELARSLSQLRLQQMEKPYFIAYRAEDIAQREISATLGSLTSSSGTPSRNRMLGVELRVGDYTVDNSNFFSMQRLRAGAGMFTGGIRQGSVDDNYAELRREFWLATDAQYKRALEDLSAKRAALKMRNGGENIPDFSKEKTVNALESSILSLPAFGALEQLARDLSAVFRSMPEIEKSSVNIKYRDVITRYVNSEGTSFMRAEPVLKLEVAAETQAGNGLPIADSFSVYATGANSLPNGGLPSQDELKARVGKMAALMVQLRSASDLDRYNGPVLFEGAAAGEVFLQEFGSRLVASRTPVSDNPQFEMFFTQMLDKLGGASFQDKVGARVLPEFMSVRDLPRTSSWNGAPLFGSVSVDDDGVETRDTALVEHGILRTLLTSRVPARGFLQSTGSRRGFGPAPSNLFVTSEKTMKADELRKDLLRRSKDRGLDYAIIVRRVGGGSEASLMQMAKAMMQQGNSESMPEVYKFYADGHEEPLRGVHIVELPPEAFREIVATGDTPELYNDEVVPRMGALFSMGISSSDDLPVVSCVTPSLLFEEVSLTKTEGPFPALPVSKSPLAEK